MTSLGEYHAFKKIFRDNQKHVNAGLKLYQARRTDTDGKFRDLFESLNAVLVPLEEHQKKIGDRAAEFDFILKNGTRIKGNGYRSLLHMLSSLLLQLHQTLQKCAKDRSSMFFLPGDYISNLTAFARALEGLEVILRHAVVLLEASTSNKLLNDGELSQSLLKLVWSEYVSRDVFYGRCLGFQYPSSTRPMIKMLAIAMASYDRWYKAEKDNPLRQLLHSLWKGNKYLHNPTQMGLKLDDLTHISSVYFVKAFWSIMEQDAVKAMLNFISHSVEISHALEVPAKNIVLKGSKGEVKITPPFSEELGYRPIPLLLISHKWRQGQDRGFLSKKQPLPTATGLIVHIHGGGFVAQSPKSHEFYLRSWSQELQTPVVSIEYSLAPEASFPRPVEECAMAYCWILQNLEKLGTTGEHIVIVGDSAGGQLAITTAMKILEYGLRVPDRVVVCYPILNTTCAVSPSRFISVIDPILPVGVLLSCQQAYAGTPPNDEDLKLRRELRNKILRAKGIYLPDPNAKNVASPALTRRSTLAEEGSNGQSGEGRQTKPAPPPRPDPPTSSHTPSLLPHTHLHSSHSPEDKENTASTSSHNGVEAHFSESGSGSGGGMTELGDKLHNVELNSSSNDSNSSSDDSGDSESRGTRRRAVNGGDEAGDMVDGGKPQAKLVRQSTASLLYCRREPNMEDRLSSPEIEKLLLKLLEGYQEPAVTRDPYMSPLIAPDHLLTGLPPVHILSTALDPMLDDSIDMAYRLQNLNQPVTLNVIDNLPHGFLCIKTAANDKDLEAAQTLCVNYLKQGLYIS